MPECRYRPVCYAAKMGDGQSVAYKLLGILHHIANNRAQQEACTEMYRSVPEGFEQDKLMSQALTDGFMFGNWPWVLKEMRKEPFKG